MAFSDEDYEPNATPKLSLTKFPISKPRVPLAALTPPLHAPASIPFLWEEAPGKPRTSAAYDASPQQNSKTVCRSLDLPPRLLNNESAKMTTTPSPTTVLDWPDVSRSSLSSFSSFRSLEEGLVRLRKRESKERSSSSSSSPPLSSWESSKENTRVCSKGNFDFSSSVTDANCYSKKKFARVRRRSSFLNFSRTSSNLLVIINLFIYFCCNNTHYGKLYNMIIMLIDACM